MLNTKTVKNSHLDRARSAVVVNLVFTIFVHPNFVRCVGHLCAFGSRHRFVAVAAFLIAAFRRP
jgi:hypothetical protein